MKRIMTIGIAALLLASTSQADHAWENYHWARTTSSFDLILVNSTTSDWDAYVSQAVADWSGSRIQLSSRPTVARLRKSSSNVSALSAGLS